MKYLINRDKINIACYRYHLILTTDRLTIALYRSYWMWSIGWATPSSFAVELGPLQIVWGRCSK